MCLEIDTFHHRRQNAALFRQMLNIPKDNLKISLALGNPEMLVEWEAWFLQVFPGKNLYLIL